MNNTSKRLCQKGDKLKELVEFLTSKGIEFVSKEDFWWMKAVSLINPSFGTNITTTIGNKIYFPELEGYLKYYTEFDLIKTLSHEYVHILDSRKHKLFKLSYAFPQVLALLSFLAIGGIYNPYFYACLLFLGCLAKLPSPFRLHWELRGYTMTMAIDRWTSGAVHPLTIAHVKKALLGKTYWLKISEKALEHKIAKQIQKIENGDLVSDPAFHEIQMFLIENRMARHSILDL